MPTNLVEMFASISLANLIDILILTLLIYGGLTWLKGTRAFQILATMLGIGLVYFAASELGLVVTSLLFQYLWAVIIIVLVTVFQPEIREILDRASPIRYLKGLRTESKNPEVVDEIVKSVAEIVRHRLGALIIFQRMDRLDNVVLKGKALDAELSSELLTTIFQKTTPLHDGAVLIIDGKIASAGCILPLSRDEDLAQRYGTRHRAAIGLTERSDALCVIISEERGEVSIAEYKKITVYNKKTDFKQALHTGLSLVDANQTESNRGFLSRLRANGQLKILSLATAAFLWFIIVGPRKSELGMTVPIQYTNLPQSVEIAGKWMDRVDLRIRGSEAGIANLKPGSIRTVVDLANVVPGLNVFRISNKNILVPPGITITEIRPSDVTLNIEAASQKKVSVVPIIQGDLPEKFKVTASPAEVRIRGLQDDLKKITSAITEPVSAADLAAKGKMNAIVIVKPDGLRIEAIDPVQVILSLEAEK